jgi:signal peptidase I
MSPRPTARPTGTKNDAAAPKPPLKVRAIEFGKSIGFALVAVVILNSFVLASFQVPTGSMENTVMAGDLLFVNKFIYGGTTPPTIPILGVFTGREIEIPYTRIPGFRDPERGDVIVFIFPGRREEVKSEIFQYYLKRCVAVAGDTLRIVGKKLYVNGVPAPDYPGVHFLSPAMDSTIVHPDVFPPGKSWNPDFYGPVVIPKEGMKIALSAENIGEWATFIRREGHEVELRGEEILIDGKAATSYTVERDYVFGMGDNRDDSLDSRFWGFIPVKDVIGTPMIVYWSWDPNIPIFNLFKKLGSIRLGRIATVIN